MIKGWAVSTSFGVIQVKTVSDTRRAALVNYLWTAHQLPILCSHTDADIEQMWKHFGGHATVHEVIIERKKD